MGSPLVPCAVLTPALPACAYPSSVPSRAHINTHARARAVQEVSLDSVESTLWALDRDTDTDDEIMEGDPLDLGEVAAQCLALCIDPFAKHPEFVSVFGAGDGEGIEGPTPGRFGMPADGEDVVLDVEKMRAFFDADD